MKREEKYTTTTTTVRYAPVDRKVGTEFMFEMIIT